MKDRPFTHRLWFHLFLRVAIVFLSLVLFIMTCNTFFLDDYYISKQQRRLIENRTEAISLDITDENDTIDFLTRVLDEHNIETEIYTLSGKTLYTTFGGQVLDYLYRPGGDKLDMHHSPLEILSSKNFLDGTTLERAVEKASGDEYIIYKINRNDCIVEMRTSIELLKSNAAIANNFLILIAFSCLGISIIVIGIVTIRTAKPISEMNIITKNMASLDFSEKISAESTDEIGELADSINNLSTTLASTLNDLREKNKQLESEIAEERKLDTMRKNFVANVSHELKTPISVVQGYAEVLKENINTDNKETYCDIIIDESKRMNKLVLSLLNLSKFESGGQKLNLKEFDITELVKALAGSILKDTDYKISAKSVMCKADPELIEQVIKSYLENAVSHNKGKIEISIKEKKDKAEIFIYNDGDKIDEKIMPLIWQSFYRGDTSHKRDKTRFGLGLSIVAAILKLHNESYGVYNNKNGVTFWFSLQKSKIN